IKNHRSEFGVERMCRVLGVARSGFYSWLKRPDSARKQADAALVERIKAAFKRSRELYGYLRITRELNSQGIRCGKNRVARLMRENGLRVRSRRKFKATTNSKHSYPVAENVLGRNFAPEGPNEAWACDITYIPTDGGWLCLASVVDLYSRMAVGWAMNSTMTHELALNALNQAVLRRRPGPGLIHHSDRRSQYASHACQRRLRDLGFVSSMSRKGNPYDNACAESFYHTLKVELVRLNRYRTRAEARQSVFEYIEVFYNRQRIHSANGYKGPCDYERATCAA
ncbi:MAG: IS3 family transposase, partial [Firmicutes bacterium]|nr:IS3 family transposase [Bacillota bacterium]